MDLRNSKAFQEDSISSKFADGDVKFESQVPILTCEKS